jgi:hypothetical protein
MKKMLAMLILGASIAWPAAGAFARDDSHPDHPVPGLNSGLVSQTDETAPGDPGMIAGPGQTPAPGPYFQLRIDNMGR